MNNISLIGRLGADPELKRTQNDFAVTSFSIAVNRPKAKDGTQVTDWIDCVAWRHTAEFIEKYFHKGEQIAIEGSLQVRSYEDKNGNKRKAAEVIVNKVHFCGGKSEGRGQNNQQGSYKQEEFSIADNDEDLPF